MAGIIAPQPQAPSPLRTLLAAGGRPPSTALSSFLTPGAATIKPQPQATQQDARKALFADTVGKVRAGALSADEGGKRLAAAGFPPHDNPFVQNPTGGTGGVLHAVAAPLGLSRKTNVGHEDQAAAEWDLQHPEWVRAHPKEAAAGGYDLDHPPQGIKAGGTVAFSPGGFFLRPIGQLLAAYGQEAVNAPGGGAALIEHPVATAKELARNVEQTAVDPTHHIGNALLAGGAALSGVGSILARAGGAAGAVRAGEGFGAALTRPGHEGGSILHAPEPGVSRIYAPGGVPEPVAGPLEQAQARATALEQQLVENANRHVAARVPLNQDVGAAVEQRQTQFHDQGLEPPPELNMAIRLGRERQRIQANLDQAHEQVAQHTEAQAGQRLLPAGVAEGPRAAIAVDRLLPRNVVARQISKARNAHIQKVLLDKTPTTPRTAIGKAFREVFSPQATIGREIRAAGRVEAAGAAAPAMQLGHATEGVIGHGLSRGEHAAIGVVGAEGTHAFGGVDAELGAETPEQVIQRHIDTHQRHIDEGKDLESNQQHIADLRMALPHLENPTPKLMRAVEFSRRVSQGTEQQLIDAGHLTRETADQRRANLAAMYRGKRSNPTTPSKEGVSPALDAVQARTQRLEAAYDALDAKGLRGGYTVSERPRTPVEAQQRLQELEQKVEGFRQGVAAKMFNEKLTPEELAEQRARNTANGIIERQNAGLTRTGMQAKRVEDKLRLERGKLDNLQKQHGEAPSEKLAGQIRASRAKVADLETQKLAFKGKRLKSGASSRKGTLKPLVRDEQARQVSGEIDRLLELHKDEPWAQGARKEIDELDALRQALQPRAGFMDEPAAGDVGTVRDATYKASAPSLERRGAATSVSKDELEQAQRRAANRVEPTGFPPGTKPPEGSFFFPMSRRYTDETPKLSPSHARTQLGEFGMSPPSHRDVISSHEFTGESVENARQPVAVARTIAQRATNVNRLLATEKLYDRMWKGASATRRSVYDVPIRYSSDIHDQLRAFFGKLSDQLHATPDEELHLNADELKRLTDLLQPTAEHGDAAVGSKIDGVRWVDKRFLKSNGEVSVRGPLEKMLDAVNNPVRSIQLYARPAYILNLLGNLGMQGVTEGARVFPSMRRAVTAAKTDGADNTALIDSYMGTSRSRSYNVSTGPGHEMNRRLAEAWNQVTDMYSRRSAFYTEAARAGFKTPQQINSLLHDAENKAKLTEVVRRSNKNIVDYDSLTPVEKNQVRRAIYFYPWVSRGTLWALRTIVENPLKTFTLAQLGQIGAEKAHLAFGDQPAWMAELGLIPVGKPHGKNNDLLRELNPSSVWTPSTLVQVGEALAHPLNKDVGLQNLETPAAGLGVALGAGGAGDTKPAGVFKHLHGWAGPLGSIIEGLPPVQAIRRSGAAPWLAGGPSKTYPDQGPLEAIAPYSVGGAYPRDISLTATHAGAEKQKPVDVRAADRVQTEQATLLSEARRVKLLAPGAPLPATVVKAYEIQTQRRVAYSRLGANATQQQRLEADIALGQKIGAVTPAQAQEWTAAGKAHPAQIAKARRWINDNLFGGKLLTEARTAVRRHGGDLHTVHP